jgi:5-methylcytosine-specific restriction protein A
LLMNFYKTTKWKHKRANVLRRDEYLCQECKKYGKSTPATTVHHIIPLAWCLLYNALLSLAGINLVSLCEQCHNKMHNRDTDKLTALGLQWVRRMGDAGLYWLEKYGGGWQ